MFLSQVVNETSFAWGNVVILPWSSSYPRWSQPELRGNSKQAQPAAETRSKTPSSAQERAAKGYKSLQKVTAPNVTIWKQWDWNWEHSYCPGHRGRSLHDWEDCSEETVAVDMNWWISTCVVGAWGDGGGGSLTNQKEYISQKIKSRSVLTLDSKMTVLIGNNIYPEKPLTQ